MLKKFQNKIHDLKDSNPIKSDPINNRLVYDKEFVISWVNLSLKTSSPLFHHTTVIEDDSEELSVDSNSDDNKLKSVGPNDEKIESTNKLDRKNTLKKYQRRKFIFEHNSGTLCSGELTAILGPSGCGKSSLLKSLNGNFGSKSRLDGMIRLYRDAYQSNDKKLGSIDHRIRISFIPQFDCFFDCLTVFETMLFTSRLVNQVDSGLNKREKQNYHRNQIETILASLDLSGALKTNINQLSGGQRKRLSIAIEILNKPDVLILDEPTTGLDSFASFKCIHLINQLIKERKIYTALMVLHQPSTITFNLIDKIYVMCKSGSIIYNGQTKDLIEFLNQIQIDLPIHTNPADLIIEIASTNDLNLINKLKNRFSIPIEQYIANITDIYQLRYAHGEFEPMKHSNQRQSRSKKRNRSKSDRIDEIDYIGFSDVSLKEENRNISDTNSSNRNKLVSWVLFEQAIKIQNFGFYSSFFNLTRRYIYLILKDKSLGRNRLIVSVLLGLFVGYMYGSEIGSLDGCSISQNYVRNKLAELSLSQNSNISLKDTNVFQSKSLMIVSDYNRRQNTGVIDNTSNMFFILLVIVLTNLIPTLTSLQNEYRVVSKEINNLNFHFFPYYCSKVFVDTLFTILNNLIFISITYYLANYPLELDRFTIYSSVLVLFSLIVTAQSLIIASLFIGNYFATIYIGLITVFPLLLYTGYLIKIFHMPKLFRMFSYTFPSYYTYEVMLISVFGMKRCSKNLDTKRRLYDIKNILRTVILKTADEEEMNDSLEAVETEPSIETFSNLSTKILIINEREKLESGDFRSYDQIKLIEKPKQKSSLINHLNKMHHSTGYHFKRDHTNDNNNSINLKQLINDKNLVRFLRLTTGLNDNRLYSVYANISGLQFKSLGNNIGRMTDSSMSQTIMSTMNQSNAYLIGDSKINLTILKSDFTNNSIEKFLESYPSGKVKFLNLSQLDHFENEIDIDSNRSTQAIEKSIPIDETSAYSSTENVINLSAYSISTEITYSYEPKSIISETVNESIDQSIESNDEKFSKSIDLFVNSTDDFIVENYWTPDFASTLSTPLSIDTSTVDLTSDDEEKAERKDLNGKKPKQINIYRLPLDPKIILDDQIPEYNIPTDAILNLLDSFFKRIGVPANEDTNIDLSDEDFDERSKLLIIYDIRSDSVAFHFRFLVIFAILIQIASYFVYRYRIHKFD